MNNGDLNHVCISH